MLEWRRLEPGLCAVRVSQAKCKEGRRSQSPARGGGRVTLHGSGILRRLSEPLAGGAVVLGNEFQTILL
jgi:hypothetical protein